MTVRSPFLLPVGMASCIREYGRESERARERESERAREREKVGAAYIKPHNIPISNDRPVSCNPRIDFRLNIQISRIVSTNNVHIICSG